jgi:hypothetical protein
LYRGWAEIGHVVVQSGGPPCQGSCHGRGHLEALASGTAADAAARELFGPEADAPLLVERARAGDSNARDRLAVIGGFLGAAIGSLANLFDPELVVVGGGFGEAAGELVLGPAQEAARREALAPADSTLRVVPAELGAEAGLVGAASSPSRRSTGRGDAARGLRDPDREPRRRDAPRARRAPRRDLVLCEDTRRTRILLDRHGIDARLVSFHRHNEAARAAEVMTRLGRGERIALVSDAASRESTIPVRG